MATAAFKEMIDSGTVTFRFGDVLHKLCADRGLTAADLAKLLHTDVSAISKWENGVHVPGYTTVEKIAAILDVPIEVFPNRKGVAFSRCTAMSRPEPTVVVSLSHFRRRHSPSTKP